MALRSRWRRWFRWLVIALLAVGVIAVTGLVILLHVVDFRRSPQEVASAFAAVGLEPEPLTVARERTPLAAIVAGPETGPVLCFVHGSPGGWDNWLEVMAHPDLAERWRVVAYDRPGFGATGGEPAVTLAEQARAAARVIEAAAGGRPAIVVGHSYGAPVAVRLAADRPELVTGLVLVGAAVDPDLERIAWYQRLILVPGVAALVPENLHHSNEELMPLAGELEALYPVWAQLRMPVAVVHGAADSLVPVANVAFVRERLGRPLAAEWVRSEAGHFIPWQRPELVVAAIAAVQGE